jgi:hypothetical protein
MDSIIKRLAAASERDFEGPRRQGQLAPLINAALVFAGVRAAARLEYSFRGNGREAPKLFAAIKRLGRNRGIALVQFGFREYRHEEPLVVNLDRVDANDVQIVAKEETSDVEEPLLGAMGRLLQYECPFPKAKSNSTGKVSQLLGKSPEGIRRSCRRCVARWISLRVATESKGEHEKQDADGEQHFITGFRMTLEK